MNNLILKLRKNRPSSAVLSVVLAAAILLSTFSGMFILADTSNKLWDGAPATGYQQGSGTKEDPFIVSTPAELLLTVTSTGLAGDGTQNYYKLANDIYVNDVTDPSWKADADNNQWPVVSTSEAAMDTAFGGVFNGDGHKVFGLFVDKTYAAPADGELDLAVATGLFPSVRESAKIYGVGLENSFLSLTNDCSVAEQAFAGYTGLIGYAYNTNATDPIAVDRCYIGEDVVMKSAYAGLVTGLSAVKFSAVVITNCYGLVTATVYTDEGDYAGNRFMLVSGGLNARSARLEHNFSLGGITWTGGQTEKKSNYSPTWVSSGIGYTVALANMKGANAFNETVDKNGDGQIQKEERYMTLLNEDGAFMLTQSFPVLKIFVRTESGEWIWDGTFTEPTVGEGTETAPYIINEASELAYVIKNGGKDKFYRLEKDIYLNDINKIDWTTGETEAGYTPNTWLSSAEAGDFNGTIDGNGHVVYGLYYKKLGTSTWDFTGTGLIPLVKKGSKATLKNLGLDKAYVNNNKMAGGLFGGNAKGEIVADQCYVGADVTLKGHLVGAFVGGASGQFTFTNCYSLADVSTHGATSGDSYYGLYGDAYGMTGTSVMQNCYNGNGPMTTKKVGPSTRTNIFATADPSGTGYATLRAAGKMQGLDALLNAEKMQGLGDKFVATTTYPILKIFAKASEGEQNKYWDGVSYYAPTKGDGSKEAPFEIENTYMLAYVIMTGGKDKYYKLTADIYINETDKVDWATGTAKEGYKINSWFSSKDVPVFSGTIDGDGHMVYGLYVKVDGKKEWKNFEAAAGLIPNANGKKVNLLNLGIDQAYVSHPNIAGLFIGMASRELIQITSCFTGADTYLDSYDAGALVGTASGAVIAKGCYSLTKFNSDAHLYGIIGDLYRSSSATTEEKSSFTACYVLGNFAKKGYVSTTNCYANEVEGSGSTIKLAEANMKGLDVFSNADKMPRLGAYRLYQATEGFPILRIFSDDPVTDDPIEEEETIWNGNAALFFVEGSGTKEDPYMISKGSELALLVESGGNGAYYKLKNDIYLNDVTENLWYKSANNNAWYSDSAVSCNIDGDGHCVYGLWYPKDNTGAAAGLFPKFSKGEIKNLGVRYAHVYAERFAGGFIGATARGGKKSLNQCFVDDTVQVGYTGSGNYGAGGLIGIVDSDGSTSAYTVLIDNCYSKAVVTGASDQRVNGLLGTVWKSAIQVKNSYSDGVPAYYMASGGTVSSLYWDYANGTYVEGAEGIRDINEVLSGVYTTKGNDAVPNNFNFVTAEEMRGLGAAEKMSALDFTSVWQAVEKGTPVLRVFGLKGADIDISEDGITFASGSGKKNDPYIIKTAEQLRYLVLSENTQGKYYKLGNDIYVNDTSKSNWMQNSPAKWYSYEAYKGAYFKGTLDGDGYSVYGIYINDTPETGETIINGSAGLFPNASIGATVKNLHLRDSYISGKAYAGGIIGYVSGASAGKFITLIGCSADETVTVKGQTAGGLIGGGGALTEVQYVYFTGKIEATSEGRGNAIVGDIWKKGHRAAQVYTIGYTNYRGGFYPDIAFDVYGTVPQIKAVAVSANGMYGAAAKKNMPGLNWDVWYTVNGSTPHLKVITDDMILSYSSEGKKGEVWSGFMATKFAGGSGTEEDPYLIETPEQMAYLVMNLSGTQGKFYKITADLKFNDTSKEGWEAKANEWFAPSNSFRGHLDGDGHIVSGLYYNSVNSIVGLFPRIAADAVIEKLGITESTIISTSEGGSQSFAAALSGYVSSLNKEDTLETYKLPVISQCFADDSVYVEAMFAGGLIGGNQRGVRMDNCYFTGELTCQNYAGTLIGNSWNGWESHITDCYAVSKDYDPVATGAITFFNYDGCYADGPTTKTPLVTKVTANRMKGEIAKEHMPLLDYNKIWKTVKDGTPVLRCFKNAEKYSSHREGKRTELSFATEGGDKMEAITGYSGDPIPEIKTPVRYGFDFAGWYVNQYKVIPFELEFFPDNDMVIYADWVQRGFTQGFEDNADSTYDFNEGTDNFRPGSKGYNPKYIHGGMKNMHSIPDSAVESIFLLNYKNPLEIGKEYDVNFWVFVKNEEPMGTVQFLHALHPQHDSPIVGYEEVIDLSEAKTGTWVEYRATIVANAPYLLIKTAQGNEVFYDDFQVVPTGEEGEVGKIDGFNPQGISSEPDLFGDVLGFVLGFGTIGIVVLVAAAVLSVAAVAVVVILAVTLIRKKAKKNKK